MDADYVDLLVSHFSIYIVSHIYALSACFCDACFGCLQLIFVFGSGKRSLAGDLFGLLSAMSYGLFTGSGLCLLLGLVFILDLYLHTFV